MPWPPSSPSGGAARSATPSRRWSASGSFQIACGYEDQDDADTLRSDPLLKLVCGRLPQDAALASQPTLSRLENAPDYKACYRLALALLGVYLRERERDGLPVHIVLDFDGTDDPAHGKQEGVAYHGYYDQHMVRHEVARSE
ncbi:MAG: transposase [Chloroflexi bacterium]|nr:transposase [Chloroflexota bacterium]